MREGHVRHRRVAAKEVSGLAVEVQGVHGLRARVALVHKQAPPAVGRPRVGRGRPLKHHAAAAVARGSVPRKRAAERKAGALRNALGAGLALGCGGATATITAAAARPAAKGTTRPVVYAFIARPVVA